VTKRPPDNCATRPAAQPAAKAAGPRWHAVALVAALLVMVNLGEIAATTTAHPMTSGRWVPFAAGLVAGAVRVVTAVTEGRRAGAPGWIAPAGLLLPAGEREQWWAVVASILHAEHGRRRRRQAYSFLRALPATAVLSWRLHRSAYASATTAEAITDTNETTDQASTDQASTDQASTDQAGRPASETR
jgi:hypothetical protein